jgi:hypothetical protein
VRAVYLGSWVDEGNGQQQSWSYVDLGGEDGVLPVLTKDLQPAPELPGTQDIGAAIFQKSRYLLRDNRPAAPDVECYRVKPGMAKHHIIPLPMLLFCVEYFTTATTKVPISEDNQRQTTAKVVQNFCGLTKTFGAPHPDVTGPEFVSLRKRFVWAPWNLFIGYDRHRRSDDPAEVVDAKKNPSRLDNFPQSWKNDGSRKRYCETIGILAHAILCLKEAITRFARKGFTEEKLRSAEKNVTDTIHDLSEMWFREADDRCVPWQFDPSDWAVDASGEKYYLILPS